MKTDSQQLAPRLQPPEPGTSDSLVFFGATGDLAYKQIFPALQQMILRDNFNVPTSDSQRHRTPPIFCYGSHLAERITHSESLNCCNPR